MKLPIVGVTALALLLGTGVVAFAQGGGASSTGTIQGRVTDAQGAVLPGVTVTATSPSMLGRADGGVVGNRQLPLPGAAAGHLFAHLRVGRVQPAEREGIELSLGFTATVNIELALATLQETVTVTGESPVIDTTADPHRSRTSSWTSCSRSRTRATCGRCWR